MCMYIYMYIYIYIYIYAYIFVGLNVFFCLFYNETADILDENGTYTSNVVSVSSRKCSI